MLELGVILKDILLPIFVIMFFGYWMQKKFQLNVQTLARLNIYFLVPGFIFVKLYSTTISMSLFGNVLVFSFFMSLFYMLFHTLLERCLNWRKVKKRPFRIVLCFSIPGITEFQ